MSAMKRSIRCVSAVGCLSVLFAAGIVFATENVQPKQLWVSASITIDAQGRASIEDLVGAKGALAEVVRAEITNASYLPASREGKPVASKMELRARVMLTPVDGDDYAVKLDAISLAPLLRRATPPRYPIGMAQRNLSGHVTLELTIGADGRVIRAEAVDATDPVFSKEVLAVVKGWRFESSSVDGSNFEYVVTLPIWFQASKHQTPPEFVCRRDERRPRWKQQSKPDCLDLLLITFVR